MDGAGANALNDARDPKWESLTEEEQAALRTVMARAKVSVILSVTEG